jgi:hypothetical protein
MLPLKSSSVTRMNVFGEVWTAHRSLGSSNMGSRGQTPRFHTPRFVQGIEAKLDEHIRGSYVLINNKIQCIDDKYFPYIF